MQSELRDAPSEAPERRHGEVYVLRAARHPPVKKPEMIAFHMSSFCRHPFTAQSNVENMPPQTPKLPPVTGALALMTDIAPTRRSPWVNEEISRVLKSNTVHVLLVSSVHL